MIKEEFAAGMTGSSTQKLRRKLNKQASEKTSLRAVVKIKGTKTNGKFFQGTAVG